ncbi:hypothetical protein [uncultured Roseobacter sp.]|uniref:hypothetical protein n=1 Tax=uncultured Roseobacter sp. TaxID=114847 RepID=UPI00260290AE|nr:hypothetical protein [uncultured Roseobacter sp.]
MDSSEVEPVWALFQAGDLFRLAYETLLFAGLRILTNAPPNSMSLNGVIEGVTDMADLPRNQSLQEWIHEQIDYSDFENHAKTAAHALQESLTSVQIRRRSGSRERDALPPRRRRNPRRAGRRPRLAQNSSYVTRLPVFADLIDQWVCG